jgi:hypothetical protein
MASGPLTEFEIIEVLINDRLVRFSIQRINDQVLVAGSQFHKLEPLLGRDEETAARAAIAAHFEAGAK